MPNFFKCSSSEREINEKKSLFVKHDITPNIDTDICVDVGGDIVFYNYREKDIWSTNEHTSYKHIFITRKIFYDYWRKWERISKTIA